MPPEPAYLEIVRHYESCLKQHGPTPQGVDWPNAADLARRFEVMLGVLRPYPPRPQVLDLGCGPALLLDHPGAKCRMRYTGLDLSPAMVEAARRRWPKADFLCRDVLADPLPAQCFDYVLMNGVLTEKRSLDQAAMLAYAERLIEAAFAIARVGIAFNVMSAHVDWRRDDLFHWAFDDLFGFLKARLSRHAVLRADYGLYEYTVYLYREPA